MAKNKDKKKISIVNFFVGVKKELPKIKWTSKKNLFKYSIAVVFFIVFIALFFLIIDLLVSLITYIKELMV